MSLVPNWNTSVLALLEDWIVSCKLRGLVFLGSQTILFGPLQLTTDLKHPDLQVLHKQISMLLSTVEPKKCTKDSTYLHQVLPRVVLMENINAEVF